MSVVPNTGSSSASGDTLDPTQLGTLVSAVDSAAGNLEQAITAATAAEQAAVNADAASTTAQANQVTAFTAMQTAVAALVAYVNPPAADPSPTVAGGAGSDTIVGGSGNDTTVTQG